MQDNQGWLLGGGVLLVGYAEYLRRRRQRLLRTGRLTTGVVVGFDDGLVVRFYTSDQREITSRQNGPARAGYLKGDTVRVYYDPQDPETHALDEPAYAAFPWLLMALGGLCGLCGLCGLAGWL